MSFSGDSAAAHSAVSRQVTNHHVRVGHVAVSDRAESLEVAVLHARPVEV